VLVGKGVTDDCVSVISFSLRFPAIILQDLVLRRISQIYQPTQSKLALNWLCFFAARTSLKRHKPLLLLI